MTKIDYVMTDYNKATKMTAVVVRYDNGNDMNYNPDRLPSTVKKFISNATQVDRDETKHSIRQVYYEVN